ncbi:beta-N-acetylhexosaminidase [Sphingobacterium psychroaquaticum]|uniref:glycoside hydrolase family 20 protein n=1 Tax=Sphingobacterium psychroaquaticum TaxID=561061 RepID=UPI00106D28B6|nr:family 20 glycosylhydrolase [Sphingobacterium psychroaquaticum]QBQ42423.1 beta-N-acetylhexosaminidase [Sphingobacterium psychroaquaticum]
MRYLLVLLSFLGFQFFGFAQQQSLDLIPVPNKITYGEGTYTFATTGTPLYITESFADLGALLSEYPQLKISTTEILKKVGKKHNQGIRLFQAEDIDKIGPKAYRLTIDNSGILLKAHNKEAMLSGLYTLIQIGLLQEQPQYIPQVTIDDSPRFSYRGLHLDVSRHFMPLSFIKKYIDVMALYKFNVFHWHLTDGAGWRLEIKQYPELTQKAAWRTHASWKDWWNNGRQYIEQGAPNAYGGYYTQEQAKELVAYAASKGITVIPEIEMPGHSEEVLAVYPHLACTGKPYTQGEFCIGNPETFVFLKNVLDEVLTIFPSPYIHIGGDEAEKKHWASCDKCQSLKKKENLKDEHELQSYAIKQMDEYLQAKGRKLIGWDEILEGGLTKGATVMSWRGEEGGIKAANAGHDVIMTPGEYLYFDSYQTDPRSQPETIGGYLPIDKVYAYNPIPKGIEKDKEKHILGAQANLWAEYMPTYQQVEYMAFPRALALAEINWTNQENRSWVDFKARLQKHYRILQELDVNYYRPSYDVRSEVTFHPDRKSNTVSLTSEQTNPVIFYTTNDAIPTSKSTRYTNPIELAGSHTIKAASFIDSFRVSAVENIRLDIHKAIGMKVYYNTPWEGYPAQKELTLTNGINGGLTYQDKQWQGFTKDIDLYVDFERREEIKSVTMRFMQMPGPGVYFPGVYKVYLSDNGKNYREVGVITNYEDTQDPKLRFKTFTYTLDKPQMARYVKVVATNPMKGYLFTDELIIY